MHKRFTKTLLAGAIAGAGIISAGNLVANAYDTEDPAPVETTIDDSDGTTSDDGGAVEPQGLVAQVDPDADTDTETDTPADAEQGDGERRGGRGGHGGCGNEAVADVLGVTVDELSAEREAGNSLADIAADAGIPVNDVVEAIVADRAEHIAEKVEAGDITQAEADDKLTDLETRALERVNRTPGE